MQLNFTSQIDSLYDDYGQVSLALPGDVASLPTRSAEQWFEGAQPEPYNAVQTSFARGVVFGLEELSAELSMLGVKIDENRYLANPELSLDEQSALSALGRLAILTHFVLSGRRR